MGREIRVGAAVIRLGAELKGRAQERDYDEEDDYGMFLHVHLLLSVLFEFAVCPEERTQRTTISMSNAQQGIIAFQILDCRLQIEK